MLLSAPWFLLALLPFSVLVAYLLRGRPPAVTVPYLPLWQGDLHTPRSRRAFRPPPLPILLILLAILLAILAAAGPLLKTGQQTLPPITLILDRGLTLSAGDGDDYRFRALAREVQDTLQSLGPIQELRILPIPGTPINDAASISAAVERLSPTALLTQDLIPPAVASALRQRDGVVIVITDTDISINSDRLIIVRPQRPFSNAGIVHIASRLTPTPQLMVTLRNDLSPSRSNKVLLRVESDSALISQRQLELPPPGQTRNFFVDLPKPANVLTIHLELNDDLPLDDVAWLVRRPQHPRLEIQTSLSPDLARFFDRYTELRPPGRDAPTLVVQSDQRADQVPAPAIFIADPGSTTTSDESQIHVTPHPITSAVPDWSSLANAATAELPPGNWKPLLRIAGRPAVAIRETGGVRQVWIGFDSPTFPRTPSFVIFWTNLIEWAANTTTQEYTSHPVTPLPPEWAPLTDRSIAEPGLLPGLYQRTDGVLRAVNAAAPIPSSPTPTPWREQLRSAIEKHPPQETFLPLTSWLSLLSLLSLLLALVASPRNAR